MNHLSKCLYGILALICFASCSKNDNPAPTEDQDNDVPKDTVIVKQQDTLLSKAIIWDSVDLATGAYSPYTWEFLFDDQKRVKMLVIYDSDTNGVRLPAAKIDTNLQCFYNGAERNVSRSIGGTLFWPSKTSDVLHFYNSNNQIIKDSIKSGTTFYRTRTYTYLPDKLLTDDYTVSSPLPSTHQRDTFQVVNNNIVSGRFTTEPSQGQNVFGVTYDNKINPLTKLTIAPVMIIEGGNSFEKGAFLSPGFCKNNITKRSGYWSNTYIPPSSPSTAIETFQYTYNELNLPVYCKKSYTIYNSVGRVKYIYTH